MSQANSKDPEKPVVGSMKKVLTVSALENQELY